ncbi:hypothetical protein [Arcobacter ellisii]|uniref:Uncharacterized protein n=1 Tax=Arcobacter ellisii TaxID=913109 RepID=A0A347UA21_9BACT|nr:hypothetical protein [Arcobacter ellisii]AXX95699.1 hypothetical protein AELL_2055 [Arcobacter ellisii]RXI31428.1 hypothetical protein CP962_04770 [Arcobacter ellisii]
MDLFTPRVKDEQLHPYFKKIIKDEKYKNVLTILENWSKGLDARKKEEDKFVKELQISFNSSLWELYLNKAFQDLGFKIDYSKESPDFNLIHSSGRTVNVEAVTSNNKSSNDEGYYSEKAFNETINTKKNDGSKDSILKLLGKIKDKKDLFVGINNKKNPYSELEHVRDKPFVIALAPFDNHLSHTQNNTLINQVLFGVLPPTMRDINNSSSKKINHIVNNNGKEINLGIFTNDSYKEISAIIFSTTGTFGKAISQSQMSNTTIKSTRFRIEDFNKHINTYGIESLGYKEIKLSQTHTVISMRIPMDDIVFGSDVHFCNLSEHYESHLDGLHIYYNPYANIPLDDDLFSAYEITQNYFDKSTREIIPIHNDNSLVSRQVYIH